MLVILVLVPLVVVSLLAMHLYLWRRLVRDTTTPGSIPRRTGTTLLLALPLTSVAAMLTEQSPLPFSMIRAIAWPGYLWLAVVLYLALFVLAADVLRWAVRAVQLRRRSSAAAAVLPAVDSEEHAAEAALTTAAPGSDYGFAASAATAPDAGNGSLSGAAPSDPSRRLFVARTAAVAASALTVGTVGYGTYSALRGPRLKRVIVPLARLPRSAHGFRIAVVSDIHLGPILGRGHTQRIVDTINSAQPDLIAIVGDLVDGSVEDLGPAVEPLAELSARHGTYFVTGNHEYYSGASQWIDKVRELGVQPLENARAELPGFDLAGVNDIAGEEQDPAQGPDYVRALGGRDRSRTSVLLAHQPVMIHEAVAHGVDLQLSGHTHGGQLWPVNHLAQLSNPTVAGLERYGDTELYVTRGAGTWGPPVRIGAPSDITIVTLASRGA
ncbi:metallophosphoesterase [Streptomyces sp. H27-C3]|uniref:metallophosphoesterase n=1 Tax=Streptomyces sp. H27-C3 TaxID=3046305 RepID=UPI0024BB6FC0|nr:metallophosphoesterase [Streptomyces sp. H27-C3]MDJ0466576.1 metallophosphoesterase [Streptomyces sp. H27-C3]